MKLNTRDEAVSAFDDVKGRVPETAGPLAPHPGPLAAGRAKTTPGKIQRGVTKTAEMHEEFAPDLGKE
jgi:uncharacterized protein YjbJ (UPF0337 family)